VVLSIFVVFSAREHGQEEELGHSSRAGRGEKIAGSGGRRDSSGGGFERSEVRSRNAGRERAEFSSGEARENLARAVEPSPQAAPTPRPTPPPAPVVLSMVGEVPNELVAAAGGWFAELLRAVNLGDVERVAEMLELGEGAAAAFAKVLEDRPNMEMRVQDASIENLGDNRVRIKYVRVDNWYDVQRQEPHTATLPMDQVFVVVDGKLRLEK
jgi:hypothetical protein